MVVQCHGGWVYKQDGYYSHCLARPGACMLLYWDCTCYPSRVVSPRPRDIYNSLCSGFVLNVNASAEVDPPLNNELLFEL